MICAQENSRLTSAVSSLPGVIGRRNRHTARFANEARFDDIGNGPHEIFE
jgi:hypothetical protein